MRRMKNMFFTICLFTAVVFSVAANGQTDEGARDSHEFDPGNSMTIIVPYGVEGGNYSILELQINDKKHSIPFSELMETSQSHYLRDFLTGAYHIGRLIPEAEYVKSIQFQDEEDGSKEDFYHVRVGQKNNHWAWSSPIWIQKE